MINVAELKGYKSLRALNAFHTLLLGVKMLPSYMGQSYEEFYGAFDPQPIETKEKLIREAVLFVELQLDEVESLLSFCIDANGIPFARESTKKLPPEQIFEMIVAVCVEIAKIKINFVSPAEKKN